MKNFKLAVLTFFVLFLSSCTITQDKLWGAKIDDNEIIKDLLINNDGTKLVLVGKKYHYFLNDELKKVQKISEWEGKEKLEMGGGSSAKGQNVEYEINFRAHTKDLSKKEMVFLESNGAKRFDHGEKISLPRVEFRGVRLVSDPELIKSVTKDFFSTNLVKIEYNSSIFENPTPLQITGKILLTPFAMAADIILMPITIPYSIYRDYKESKTDYYCQGEFCGYDKIPELQKKLKSKQLKNN